jgi:tRNA_anti-like
MQIITKKKAIVAAVIIALTAGLYGYIEYTKTNMDLTYAKADHVSGAREIIKEFEENEQAANTRFLDKIIAVNGSIKDVMKDDRGFYTVMVGNEGYTSSVRCSMDADHQLRDTQLQLGSNITIKGICTGFNADQLLGSDVILNRCVIEKK